MNTLRLLLVVPALLAGTATAPAQGVVIRAQPEQQQQGDEVAELLRKAQEAHAAGRTQVAAELMAKAQAMLAEQAERQHAERQQAQRRERAEAERRERAAVERRDRAEAERRLRAVEERAAQQQGAVERVRVRAQDPERQAELERLRARVAELEGQVAARRGQGGVPGMVITDRRWGTDAPQAGPSGPSVYRLAPTAQGGPSGGDFYRLAPTPQRDAAPRAVPAPRAPRAESAPQRMDANTRLLRGIHEELRGIREELAGIRESLSAGPHGRGDAPHGQPFGRLHAIEGPHPGAVQYHFQGGHGDGQVLFGTLQPGGEGQWLQLESFGEHDVDAILHDVTEMQRGLLLDVQRLHEGHELFEVEEIQELELQEAIELETIVEEQEDGSVRMRVITVPQPGVGGGAGGAVELRGAAIEVPPPGNVRYRVNRGGGSGGTVVMVPEPPRPPQPGQTEPPARPLPPLPSVEKPAESVEEPAAEPQPDASSAFFQPIASATVETR
jgi:hypothetical protein